MKISFSARNFALVLMVLIPVLPEYFRVLGQPVYQYMTVLVMLIMTYKRVLSNMDKRILISTIFPIIVLYLLPRIYHRDLNPIVSSFINPIMLMLCVFLYLRNKNDLQRIIDAFIKVGIGISILAFFEYFWEYNIFTVLETVDLGNIGTMPFFRNNRIRVESSFGTAIGCGIYMCVINILCLFRLSGNEKNKKLYLIGYVLSALTVYLTQSRMPLLTLAFANLIFIIKKNTVTKIIIFFILIFILLIDGLTVKIIYNIIWDYINLIVAVLMRNTNVLDTSSAYRTMLGDILVLIIDEHPIIGYGQKFMDDFKFKVWGYTFTSIDNNYLNMLLLYGIVGLIAQLFPFIYSLYLIVKMKFKEVCFPIFVIITVYLINLVSVAQMAEGRFLYMFVPMIWFEYKNFRCQKY